MPVVLDTHTFFWWRTNDRLLSRTAEQAIERADRLLVPDIVCWEIAYLVSANRLRLDRPARSWLDLALNHPRVELVPITPEIAVAAVSLGSVMNRDPMDGLIAATALRLGWPLVTRDTDLKDLAAIETIW
jgi:PIN domain nuclease of toxin-antitoxin system